MWPDFTSLLFQQLGRYDPRECRLHLHDEFGADKNGLMTRLKGNYHNSQKADAPLRAFDDAVNPHKKPSKAKSKSKRKSSRDDIVYIPNEHGVVVESHDSSVGDDDTSLPQFPLDAQSVNTEPIRTSKKYHDQDGDQPNSALEMLYKEG